MTAPVLRIYGDKGSGNCLKVLWTAESLRIPYEWIGVDVTSDRSETRGTRTAAFLAMNPAGEIPVVVLPDGRTLAQSNAIIRYLARGSGLLPNDAFAQAKIDEWLFWEQYSHEPYIAVSRFQMKYLGRSLQERESWRVERGEKALDRLESALGERKYLTGGGFTVADIALLAYTRLADEGGFSLASRTATRGWVARCEMALGIEASALNGSSAAADRTAAA